MRYRAILSFVSRPVFQPLTLDRKLGHSAIPVGCSKSSWMDSGRSGVSSTDDASRLPATGTSSNLPHSERLHRVRSRSDEGRAGTVRLWRCDDHAKPDFKAFLFRRGEPGFVAFDPLYCDGQDLSYSPLTDPLVSQSARVDGYFFAIDTTSREKALYRINSVLWVGIGPNNQLFNF